MLLFKPAQEPNLVLDESNRITKSEENFHSLHMLRNIRWLLLKKGSDKDTVAR